MCLCFFVKGTFNTEATTTNIHCNKLLKLLFAYTKRKINQSIKKQQQQ